MGIVIKTRWLALLCLLAAGSGKLFDVTSASVWRLGTIPNYELWDVAECFAR